MLQELCTVRPGSLIAILGHELRRTYYKYLGEGLCVPLQVVVGPEMPEFIIAGEPKLLPQNTKADVVAEPPKVPLSTKPVSVGWQNPALAD